MNARIPLVSIAFFLSGAAALIYQVTWQRLLALPTILMGMSLPLLVRAMVRDTPHAARTVGLLYGVNVLGACAGALVTPWVLVRFYGIREALLVAGAGNLAAAFIGLTAGVFPSLGSESTHAVGLLPERPVPATLRLSAWAA